MPELRQRQPRKEDAGFLIFLRKRRCCACDDRPPSQAAHIRMACPERGKRQCGKGEKPDDRWAVPLCRLCHTDGAWAQHKVGEEAFWRHVSKDPFVIAARLYARYAQTPSEDGSRLPKPPRRVKRTSVFRSENRRPKVKLRGLTFQQQRCARRDKCLCDQRRRKTCVHYRQR